MEQDKNRLEVTVGKDSDTIDMGSIGTRERFVGTDGEPLTHHQVTYPNLVVTVILDQKILLRDRAKYHYIISYEPVGENSPSASDRNALAWFISQLPSRDLLNQVRTFDQFFRWVEARNYCLYIAKCFSAGHKQSDDPHAPGWLSARYYENIWKIISIRWADIREGLQHEWGCPFTTARELLEDIIQCDVEGEFSVIFKHRHEDKPSEMKRFFKQAKRNLVSGDLTPKEEKFLDRIVSSHSANPVWWERVNQVAQKLAVHDPLMKSLLVSQSSILKAIATQNQKAIYQSKALAENWVNSKKLPRTKDSKHWKS